MLGTVAVQRTPPAAELVAEFRTARSRPHRLVRRQASWAESLLFLSLLISNALLLRVLAVGLGARIYRTSYSELRTERAPQATRQAVLARPARDALLTPLLTPQMRLLIVKDLRLFRRDPVQWSQFIIFFGLLALYFANIRRFSYDVNYMAWVNMISFLNLAVVGLILSTFTTRFIFPMLSLEGRRFWILSMLPVRRDSILWGKFVFAAAGSAIPCCLLILLSDVMLPISPLVMAIHQLTVRCCALACRASRSVWGENARPARGVALENRRGLRRHVEPGRQRHVHRPGRAADGAAHAFLSLGVAKRGRSLLGATVAAGRHRGRFGSGTRRHAGAHDNWAACFCALEF